MTTPEARVPGRGAGFPGEVDPEPLRAAVIAYVESGQASWGQVALRAGYRYSRRFPGKGDVTSLKRRLGMALKICKAIKLDPVDAGL